MQEKNKKRFSLLRGYYQSGKFHPQGGAGVELDEFLNLLGFRDMHDFIKWYVNLTHEEVNEGKREWCPGNDCQSNLKKLITIKEKNGHNAEFWVKVNDTLDKIMEEENKNGGKLSEEAYKRIFPKGYDRFLRLGELKKLCENKLKEIRSKNNKMDDKIDSIKGLDLSKSPKTSMKERIEAMKRIEKVGKELVENLKYNIENDTPVN